MAKQKEKLWEESVSFLSFLAILKNKTYLVFAFVGAAIALAFRMLLASNTKKKMQLERMQANALAFEKKHKADLERLAFAKNQKAKLEKVFSENQNALHKAKESQKRRDDENPDSNTFVSISE